jgi:thiamine-monophosphate kinase
MARRRARAGTVGALGEDELIEIFAATSGQIDPHLVVPNGDDAAAFVLEPMQAGVVTTDTLVEGVHFDLAYCPPHTVGRKLVSINMSDLAAMGARPRYILLSVTMSPEVGIETAEAIAGGIREKSRAHGVTIIGGNTARIEGPMVLSATIIGRAPPEELVRRRGTLMGDALFVTGRLGDANAGLRLARSGRIPEPGDRLHSLFSALVDPIARVSAGRALGKSGLIHAMCDISDGFGRDVGRLLAPEGLGAHIDANALPISEALSSYAEETGESAEMIALEGGEDYELLFAADPDHEKDIIEVLAETATPVARIGQVTAGEMEVFLSDGSVIAPPEGWDHFRGSTE